MLTTKFPVAWPFGAKSAKIDFQHGCYCDHLGFPTRRILSIFDLQVSPILPIKFWVSWPFRSVEVQNRFSRCRLWQPPWISSLNNLSYFRSISHPLDFQPSLESIGISVKEKKFKTDLQNGGHGRQLGFPTGMLLTIFDLRDAQVIWPKFRVTSAFHSEEFKTDFQDGHHGGHLGFSMETIFSFFYLQVTLILPIKFQLAFRFRS